MRFLLVGFIFLAWAVLGMIRPSYASGLLLWVDIGAPLELAYAVGSFPISLLALVAILSSFAVNVLFRGHKLQPNFFVWVLIAFMAWGAVSAAASPLPATAWEGWVTTLKYLAPLALVSMSIRSFHDAKFVAGVLAFSVGIWGAQIGIGCLKNGVNNAMHIGSTQMGDNNFLASAFVALLPTLIFLFKDYHGPLRLLVKSILLLCAGLNLASIVFSNSRGAAVALVGNLVIYVIFISKRKIRDFILLIAAGAIVAMILPQSFYDRMSTLKSVGTEKADDSIKERAHLVQSTIRAIGDYPITGIGPYNWINISMAYSGLDRPMNPHNIWLKCAVEVGFPGVFLFLVLVVGTIIRLVRLHYAALRAGQKSLAGLALALATGLISYAIGMTFLSNYDLENQWAWMAIGNALVTMSRSGVIPMRGGT